MNSIAGTVMWLPVVGTRKAFFPLRLEDRRTKLEKEPMLCHCKLCSTREYCRNSAPRLPNSAIHNHHSY